mgnify:CR=1 FL=1
MNKLNKLMSMCKIGATIRVNSHKGLMTAKEALFKVSGQTSDSLMTKVNWPFNTPEDAKKVISKIIETDSLVTIKLMSENVYSYFMVIHHDLEAAIDEAISILEKQQ